MNRPKLTFTEGVPQVVQFKYGTPKTGTTNGQDWLFYTCIVNGAETTLFPPPHLKSELEGMYLQDGQVVQITQTGGNKDDATFDVRGQGTPPPMPQVEIPQQAPQQPAQRAWAPQSTTETWDSVMSFYEANMARVMMMFINTIGIQPEQIDQQALQAATFSVTKMCHDKRITRVPSGPVPVRTNDEPEDVPF